MLRYGKGRSYNEADHELAPMNARVGNLSVLSETKDESSY